MNLQVSIGEALDKLTILELKYELITDENKKKLLKFKLNYFF